MHSELRKKLINQGELYLRVKARPAASLTAIKEIREDGTVKIDIAAPPIRGRANQELIKFLAKIFNLDKENVIIISGAAERTKLIKLVK